MILELYWNIKYDCLQDPLGFALGIISKKKLYSLQIPQVVDFPLGKLTEIIFTNSRHK
jgi:hypothetical protein